MRQLRFFKFGCWAAAITAVVHLVGFVSGGLQPANDTEQALLDTARNYQFPLPGGTRRSLMEITDGFSLSFALFLATIAGLGFLIARRGADDPVLMTSATRTLAAFSLVLFVISLWYWFLIPTLFIAMVALGFVLAAVSRKT
jgi:magnesium-transporting ATPase (P-type)